VAGSFAWTGFDYKGEPSPFSWPNIHSNFGIMDMCGFPKDNYYYYLSWWKTDPIVHLLPHWNWAGKEGVPIKVIAFSNCDSVELFLNGTSLGSQVMPRNGHLQWTVPYQPGTLSAKGTTDGKIIAQDTVETTRDAASIVLKADRTVLAADGEDVIPVEVDIIDSKGRVVPTADNHVTFTIAGSGKIAGVGNGNPIDHDPDTASFRNAFNGKCVVVVKAAESPGPIHLTAQSDGLTGAKLDLASRR
jgi:beta-galactosidase